MRFLLVLTFLLSAAPFARAVNPIPPPGVPVPEPDRAALTAGVAALGKEIDALRTVLKPRPELLALLPDVMIFHKSVDWALRYDEFFNPKHIDANRMSVRGFSMGGASTWQFGTHFAGLWAAVAPGAGFGDRKSTRLNSSHG